MSAYLYNELAANVLEQCQCLNVHDECSSFYALLDFNYYGSFCGCRFLLIVANNICFFSHSDFTGVRAVNVDRYTGNVAGRIGNWARVYICNA